MANPPNWKVWSFLCLNLSWTAWSWFCLACQEAVSDLFHFYQYHRLQMVSGGCVVQTPAQAEYPEYLQGLEHLWTRYSNGSPLFLFFIGMEQTLGLFKFIQHFSLEILLLYLCFWKSKVQWDVLQQAEHQTWQVYKDGIRCFYCNQLYCAGWCFPIFYDICCSASKSVLINSCMQNNRENLVPDGWETKLSRGQNLTKEGEKCSRNHTIYSPCHPHQF